MSIHVSLPEVTTLSVSFVQLSRRKMSEEYFPKIEQAVLSLTEDQLWAKPNLESNSVGNILLHLSGNIRQWIIHGVGGEQNVREREKEFLSDTKPSKEKTLDGLRTTITTSSDVLKKLELLPDLGAVLHEHRTIQGIQETVFSVIYHVTEHMSYHTGQIIYITKAMTGTDMKFYDL